MNINTKLTYAQALQLQVVLFDRKITVDPEINNDFGEFTATLTGEIDGEEFVIYCDHLRPILQDVTGNQVTLETGDPSEIVNELFKFLNKN